MLTTKSTHFYFCLTSVKITLRTKIQVKWAPPQRFYFKNDVKHSYLNANTKYINSKDKYRFIHLNYKKTLFQVLKTKTTQITIKPRECRRIPQFYDY